MTVSGSGPLATARTRLSRGVDASRLVGAARSVESTLGRWARGSRLVGWFLVAPDPGVVRIDLRESALLGPPLGLATWVGGRTGRLVAGSSLAGADSRTAARVAAAPLRWLGAALTAVSLVAVLVGASGGEVPGGPLVIVGVALLLTRERRSGSELAATRLGRALEGAFEPPDEPGRGDG